MLERRRASVQSLLDDVVLVAQELLQDARPPDVTGESLACPVRRTAPSIGVAETEDCAFGHRAMLCHQPRRVRLREIRSRVPRKVVEQRCAREGKPLLLT